MSPETKPACSRAATRIKKRFKAYRALAWKVGFLGIWIFLILFFSTLKGSTACLAGMYSCRLNDAPFDPSAIAFTWVIFFCMVLAIIKVALRVDALMTCLTDLEQEQLQILSMQEAYMRNAVIAEPNDRINNTYNSKIYAAVVRDIEDIISK
ncbi:hypothetical protein [Acinetobacter variabilis]|uniref:Uncharacterized protein n=1 Tax=Acinetobacter variabilis TaxID=70346 RepID=N8WU20_9GAMM|nr:hypothetical protein [Acinetobacter variabilis]ENV00394.1 hypothetical protein F969_00625 [Acinetobacter variabilis]